MVFLQGQFEAWVTLDGPDGARREEYAVEVNEQEKLVTCWIASEIGKTFQVCCKAPTVPFHCNGDLLLDGKPVAASLRHPNTSATLVYRSCYTSPTTERPFMFSSLEVTDDDAYLLADSSRDIGEIRLQINRVVPLQLQPHKQSMPPQLDQKVHERSKKAVVHRIGLGEEKVTSGATKVWNIKRVERLANFVFKYRNIDMLQASGIAQPSSEPQPQVPEPARVGVKRKSLPIKEEDRGDSEKDGDEDADEEEKALLAKLAEVRARRAQENPNHPRKKVKKEDTSVKMNFTILPGGVIDLT
ncbi:hypothetical protein K443DRAFT_680976 [Laccaria amethystina LaAM-08-1]|uniref:DUF7918 domain-containing protein n=1 Tax=Laccaria amethystina LaAM-08-1 TaxID=1095629 RepID=A0A0C9WMH8_9AGAR|nr:hypothetical protein K443DRAFT_680976 [Laccaria amethystina LaAM-08-1]